MLNSPEWVSCLSWSSQVSSTRVHQDAAIYNEKKLRKAWGGTGMWRGTLAATDLARACSPCCCCSSLVADLEVLSLLACEDTGFCSSEPLPSGHWTHGWPNDCQKRHRQYRQRTRVSAYSSLKPYFLEVNKVKQEQLPRDLILNSVKFTFAKVESFAPNQLFLPNLLLEGMQFSLEVE